MVLDLQSNREDSTALFSAINTHLTFPVNIVQYYGTFVLSNELNKY